MSSSLAGFESRPKREKRLTLGLIKSAVESGPNQLRKILLEVLDLSKDDQERLANLLDHTSLSAIINASKTVHDRLLRIEAIAQITTGKKAKYLKEVGQLHRIIAQNPWIFGEEFHLMVDEGGLTKVMREVAEERRMDVHIDPVKTPDGTSGRVDLMFGFGGRHSAGSTERYLVVELKRPSKVLGDAEVTQCKKYGHTLAGHDAFRGDDVRWDVLLVSRKMSPMTRSETEQHGKQGLISKLTAEGGGEVRVWVKEWAQVIREAKQRHEFYRDQLAISIQSKAAMEHLKRHYPDNLPPEILGNQPVSN